jgi:hypothetical protein
VLTQTALISQGLWTSAGALFALASADFTQLAKPPQTTDQFSYSKQPLHVKASQVALPFSLGALGCMLAGVYQPVTAVSFLLGNLMAKGVVNTYPLVQKLLKT